MSKSEWHSTVQEIILQLFHRFGLERIFCNCKIHGNSYFHQLLNNKLHAKTNIAFSSTLPMKNKISQLSLKNPTTMKHSEPIKMMITEDIKNVEEGKRIFKAFVDGVVKELYLPAHSNVVKFLRWKDLANTSLSVVLPESYDLHFFTVRSDEREIDVGSFFDFLTKGEHVGKIVMLEKEFLFEWDEVEIDSKKYYHIIQMKKKEEEEEEELKKA